MYKSKVETVIFEKDHELAFIGRRDEFCARIWAGKKELILLAESIHKLKKEVKSWYKKNRPGVRVKLQRSMRRDTMSLNKISRIDREILGVYFSRGECPKINNFTKLEENSSRRGQLIKIVAHERATKKDIKIATFMSEFIFDEKPAAIQRTKEFFL